MLSKNNISFIRSLQQKKFREEEGLFIVEGRKTVSELLASDFEVKMLVGTEESLLQFTSADIPDSCQQLQASFQEIVKISAMTTPQDVIAVACMPDRELDVSILNDGWTFLLDDIRDPGNMGTILRIAHWFGVGQVVSSLNSVDYFNPKVVQASMGSIFHVPAYSMGLEGLLSQLDRSACPEIIAAVLDGENLYSMSRLDKGIILLGNESTGLRSTLKDFATREATIPSFEMFQGNRPDSLNVAISAALLISAFKSKSQGW